MTFQRPYQPCFSLKDFSSPLSPTPVVRETGRSMPYMIEPGYYEPGKLWLYGNVKLRHGDLACVESAFISATYTEHELTFSEREAEELVLSGKVLVAGTAHLGATLGSLRRRATAFSPVRILL
jgi:hypothetical protein